MADQRDGGIAWTDETWNPVRGCSRVSEGCRNCYAEKMAARFSGPGQPYEGLAEMRNGVARWTGKVRVIPEAMEKPLRWKRPRRIFVNSMSDLFHEELSDCEISEIFDVMERAHWHEFQVLTKRPERMELFTRQRYHLGGGAMEPPPRNVWLGVSIEDQKTADERVPHLLRSWAWTRFVSYEPALGPVNLSLNGTVPGAWVGGAYRHVAELLHWVVAGGESGPGARPAHPDWFRSMRDQCAADGVRFLFKQWGDHDETWAKIGKHAAGRHLDGVVHDAFPGPERFRV